MAFKDVVQDIEGFQEIQHEIEILRKYGAGLGARRGEVKRVIDMLHPARVRLEVAAILPETPSTKTLRLVSPDGYLPPFQAGQYVNLFVEIGGVRTSRPYSISSSPTQTGHWDLTVRRVADGFVSDYLLDEVRVGDTFESTSPAGTFTYNPLFHGDDLVFLAGGSGITPFMSMIREVADRGLKRKIQLVYGSRAPDDVIFQQELDLIAGRHANFTCDLVVSEPPPGYAGTHRLPDGGLHPRVHRRRRRQDVLRLRARGHVPLLRGGARRTAASRGAGYGRRCSGRRATSPAQPGWPAGLRRRHRLHRHPGGRPDGRRPGRRASDELPGAGGHRDARRSAGRASAACAAPGWSRAGSSSPRECCCASRTAASATSTPAWPTPSPTWNWACGRGRRSAVTRAALDDDWACASPI